MAIVKLSGGLGNQLFQYAAGMALAMQKNEVLKLDLSSYTESRKRTYSLSVFSVTGQKASFLEILMTKIFSPSSYLDGDFQSETYFKTISQKIREQFSLKNPLSNTSAILAHEIQKSESVAVHVRRGDYLDKQHRYRVLDTEYYTKAMATIEQKVTHPKYFFFSDDIEWVKKHIPHDDTSVFVSGKDYEDLVLMSLCKHIITANSTFSWWAAWLNANPNKIIITPTQWFSPTYTEKQIDLLPQTWLQI